MELYVSRSGTVEGPYPRHKVEEMLKQELLAPTDLGALPGGSDWSPLSDLLAPPAAGPPPLTTPPPLQVEPDTRYLDQQFMIDGKIPAGTHGKTVRQIVNEVAAGGRLVVFQYVFSVLVMTFRRNTGIHYIAPGQSAAGLAFQWSLIPWLFGWWGFPWGFIYTPAALWRNTAGGVDVSEPILAHVIGPGEADAVVRQRPKPSTGALWGVRALLFSPFLLLPLLVVVLAASSAGDEKRRVKQPGYTQFKQAESFVAQSKAANGHGNTAAATKAAGVFSNILNSFRTEAISSGDSTKKSADTKSMTTWCEVHDKRCLFIVRVPDLRRFTDGAKAALGEAAWLAAQVSARNLELPADTELAVAIKGVLLYDRMISGSLMADFDAGSPDAEELLESSIHETRTDSSVDDRLIRYFASGPGQQSN